MRSGWLLAGAFALASVTFSSPCLGEGTVVPVSAELCASMKSHHVLNPGAPVGCERLSLVRFSYFGFDDQVHDNGEIVVLDAVADRVLHIFAVLRERRFPIAKARLIDAYSGDDEASMADDNTSGFNDRTIPDATTISLHAYGVAIDLNPIENPFVTRKVATFTFNPPAGADYFNRIIHRPGKPDRRGVAEMVVAVFAENGFVKWGGYWDSPIDFQHFDIGRALAEELVHLPPAQAKERFEQSIVNYQRCRRDGC
jgi:hypothetical protein